MFKTIVWATDGSEIADDALAVTEDLARAYKSKILAVHATFLFRGGRYNGGSLVPGDDEVQAKIRSQVEGLRAQGFDAEFVLASSGFDDPPHLIRRAAEERGADLIVVGTHGRGAIPEMLFGGIAKQLLRLSACPVLVVPPRKETAVLEPTEGRQERQRAIHHTSQDVSSL